MLIYEVLCQAAAERHIFVKMQRQADISVQVVVHKAHNAIQITTFHAAKGIYNRELIGADFIHLFHNPENSFIRISHDIDRINT